MAKSRHRLIRLAELPVDTNQGFRIDGKPVLLCRTAAGVFAIENRCTHQLAPLEGGRMRGTNLFCPRHGQRFDMRTGATVGQLTKIPIQAYEVCIDEDDTIEVLLPD
ncbi:MAG: Rieske (2Fe-2S) domain protein [Hydrocarboniphaga sp.]|uniref:Rieske (2Fe-2S) protein n=1 Tax=Hydrocarboniphaga sp. TaxID=2033016 RepID=UPI0026310E22|nr:Rieske (2Fe-2S) protein [Hydrocarboniphaga sp.]MDB5970317.1 Rieske (2Fe-2S) domain protein [Hydrocarboniphaga sp.]